MAILSYDRTRKALDVIGANVVGRVKTHMGQQSINASGKTSSAIKHTLFQSGSILGVGIDSRKKLGYDILEIIDKGRKAGKQPPKDAIIRWIKDKGIQARKGQSLNQQAFMIARTIGRFGVRPRNVFDKALAGYKGIAELQLLDAIGADLDQFVDENMPKKT